MDSWSDRNNHEKWSTSRTRATQGPHSLFGENTLNDVPGLVQYGLRTRTSPKHAKLPIVVTESEAQRDRRSVLSLSVSATG